MKKILFIILLFGFFVGNAQENPREKIKALKTAYITQHLELTPQEAEKFWPVYNKYYKADKDLRKTNRNIRCNINNETVEKSKAEEMLRDYVELEDKRCSLRKKMINDLAGILPPQKIINLKEVEDDFHKKLLIEYSNRKAQNQK